MRDDSMPDSEFGFALASVCSRHKRGQKKGGGGKGWKKKTGVGAGKGAQKGI